MGPKTPTLEPPGRVFGKTAPAARGRATDSPRLRDRTLAPASRTMLPPPAALPWYHPRRVLDDLAALVARSSRSRGAPRSATAPSDSESALLARPSRIPSRPPPPGRGGGGGGGGGVGGGARGDAPSRRDRVRHPPRLAPRAAPPPRSSDHLPPSPTVASSRGRRRPPPSTVPSSLAARTRRFELVRSRGVPPRARARDASARAEGGRPGAAARGLFSLSRASWSQRLPRRSSRGETPSFQRGRPLRPRRPLLGTASAPAAARTAVRSDALDVPP